jgi:hypothetical protein
MTDAMSRATVDKYLSACHSQHGRNPITPPLGEANVLKHLKQERPCHYVECLREIDLEKHYGASPSMQSRQAS